MDRNKSAIIHQTCWILTVFYNTNTPTYLIIFGARKSVQIAPNIATATIYHFSKCQNDFRLGKQVDLPYFFEDFHDLLGFMIIMWFIFIWKSEKSFLGPLTIFIVFNFWINRDFANRFFRRPLYLWMVSLMKSLVEIGKKWFHFSYEMKFIKFLSFLNHAVFPYFPFILKLTHWSVVETKSFDKCIGFVWQFLRWTLLNWINCAKSCQPNKSLYQFIQWQQVW